MKIYNHMKDAHGLALKMRLTAIQKWTSTLTQLELNLFILVTNFGRSPAGPGNFRAWGVLPLNGVLASVLPTAGVIVW